MLPLLAGCGRGGGAPGRPTNTVFFTDVSGQAGLHFTHTSGASGRPYLPETMGAGRAFLDYDGDPDFLVTACNGRPMLLRNDGGNRNHWLKVPLEGVKSNREGRGSRLTVEAGGRRQTEWVRSGSSYCSSSELKALFGLGELRKMERVVVQWASGGVEEVRDVPVDHLIIIHEERGTTGR